MKLVHTIQHNTTQHNTKILLPSTSCHIPTAMCTLQCEYYKLLCLKLCTRTQRAADCCSLLFIIFPSLQFQLFFIVITWHNIKLPDINIKLPDINIKLPDINIKLPDINIKLPDINIKLPDINSFIEYSPFFHVHVTDRASWHVTVHRNKFLYNKTNQMH